MNAGKDPDPNDRLPETFRRLQEQVEAVRRLYPPEVMLRLQEQAEAVQRMYPPEVMRRVQEQVEAVQRMYPPEVMRRLQEQVEAVQRMYPPEVMRRLQEQADAVQRMYPPEVMLRLQEQADAVQRLTAAWTDQGPPHDCGDPEKAAAASQQLSDAVAEWAADVSAAGVAIPGDEVGFEWLELLPPIAQLKLLVHTLSVINAALLLLAYLKPGSAPMLVLLLTEVLIRMAQVLFVLLDGRE